MELSIGELARRTGVRTSALRYYETEGVLPTPARASGRRRYDERSVRVVQVLRFAQDAGFSLREIRTLFGGFGPQARPGEVWRKLAADKLLQLDELQQRIEQMRSAIRAGMKCGCVRVEDCVAGAQEQKPGARRPPRRRT